MITIQEYYNNLYFYIQSRIAFLYITFVKETPLPSTIPPKDTNLSLIPYSVLIPTFDQIHTSLVNPIPTDEIDPLYKRIALSFDAFVLQLFTKSFDMSYKLTSEDECRNAFKTFIGKHITSIIRQPSFDHTLLNPSNALISGPFSGLLQHVQENQFIIDSMYMTKYEYKPGVIPPAVKAFFDIHDHKLDLTHIEKDNVRYTKNTAGYNLGLRLLYNYLIIDTVVNKHLILAHFKIAQTGAYAVRKYMSEWNRIKHFLFNFSSGVNPVNHATKLLIGRGFGSVIKFFPFTEKGLNQYINDCIESDHTDVCFPTQPIYHSSTLEDSCNIYNVYKTHIESMINIASEPELKECNDAIEFFRQNLLEYRHKSDTEILASYMYVTSIVHEIKGNIYDYITQGYNCPTTVNEDGSVPKYTYLVAMLITLATTISMRKLFINLPNSYDSKAKETYNDMLNALKGLNLQTINIIDFDSSVQV